MTFRLPAEWEKHQATIVARPYRSEEWGNNLGPVLEVWNEVVGLISEGEPVWQVGEKILPCRYGDAWVRDTAPIFLLDSSNGLVGRYGQFNGWGNKYIMEGDSELAQSIVSGLGIESLETPMILEGGALEWDGEGRLLVSETCLCHPNRNPELSKEQISATLRELLGCVRIDFLRGALRNDHTDGHVDMLARFTPKGRVLCAEPASTEDPNRDTLLSVRGQLDALGYDVGFLPSPGSVKANDGQLLPATYLNYYVSNVHVIVPQYGVVADSMAIDILSTVFPDHLVTGVNALPLIEHGGAFHCITQQVPAAK